MRLGCSTSWDGGLHDAEGVLWLRNLFDVVREIDRLD
jgi:hypothetical protein